MARKSYINASKMIKMCRICLTQSIVMYELTNEIALEDADHIPIKEALEKVVSAKVLLNEEFPQCICPVCVSILKMSYKFVIQFEDTQKKLLKLYDKAPTSVLCDTTVIKNEIADFNVEGDTSAPVEIIFRQNKFNLKDVIVVEDTKVEEQDFNVFLRNLGQEISATFTDKSKRKPSVQDSVDVVSIYVKNSENGILPIKELKIDDDTNSVDYVVLDGTEFKIDEDDDPTGKFELIEMDTPDDIETFIIEGYGSEDKDVNKENYTVDTSNIQDVIESLIIETSSNKEDRKSDPIVREMAKKLLRVRKRKKVIKEEQLQDMIIMGPIKEEEDDEKQEHEDNEDIFEKEIQFPCELCKKIFSSKRALRAHKRRSHFPKDRQYTCEICGYKNNTRSGHVHHKNKHVGKKFTCEVCNKTYYTRAVLKVHMATHINQRQHLCNVCGKGFNYANALVYHMRLHTGERSYKCEYCGDTFRMPNSLKRHLCIHTGERPYKCKFCDRGFCSRGEVQCHENIHTGFRPYHCKHCLKGFTKTHNLKLHLLSHSGAHACEVCGKSFIEMSILSMHYKIAHKDLLEKDDDETD